MTPKRRGRSHAFGPPVPGENMKPEEPGQTKKNNK
jgi:hypothetical protein